MFENQPTLVLDLMRKSKSKPHLDDKEQQALGLVMLLKEKRRMTDHEAFEVAVETILAPAVEGLPIRRRYAKSRILRSAGYQVVESETGADALRLTRELLPSLVLLDVKLPDMNG